MSKIFQVLLLLIALGIIGGIAYLATFDLPPPSAPVEKVIPDDRLK